MGSVAEIQEGTLETVDAPTGTPIPAAAMSSPHGGEDTESTKEVAEEEGQPSKRELPESSVPAEDSVPTKRLQDDLSEKIPALLAKVEEGFSLTGQALKSVQLHVELHKQVAMDLQNLASEYHQDRTSSKYSLAQIQSLIEKMTNLDWQVSGPKNEQNTSLKSVCSKILTQVSGMNTSLKQLAQELKTSNEEVKTSNQAVIDTLNQGLNAMAQALTGVNQSDPPMKGSQFTPSVPAPPGVTPLTPATAGGVPAVPEGAPVPMGSVPAYGQPGYAATNPGVGSSATGPQPRQALRILVKDEGGRTVPIPVSPIPNPPGARLDPNYMGEFGMGFVQVRGNFHRKLPMHFLPPPGQ
jgi:hypothetical protein